jgi:hypothetical protein
MRRLSRRDALRFAAALPAGALVAACGSDAAEPDPERAPEPTLTPPPEPPFVVAQGEHRRLLMAGTPFETALHVFGSGLPGPVIAILGGVHGNEPGGWLAAERLAESLRPATGALLILPRANQLAIRDFVRTNESLGDLNRLYPGQPDGLPMAQMAAQIVATLRELHAGLVLDLHESWAFYKDRAQSGTAFLGQTVASYPTEPGLTLGRETVEAVNQRIQHPWEEFTFRAGFFGGGFGGGSSSLSLPRHVGFVQAALLVEMGQQQALERRVALHVEVVQEVARRVGVLPA